MERKNICIVGCGRIGRLHAKNLSRSGDLFFHSRSTSSAEKLNRRFRGKGVFKGYAEVLDSAAIDAVVICSPPEYHKEQVIQALRVGKSVLVEKPMCVSVTEIEEIEQAVQDGTEDSFLMVAENYYYKPALKKIEQLLRERMIGEIRSVLVAKQFSRPVNGWRGRYGALLEGGIHFIALISEIFDDTPRRITAHFPNATASSLERYSITKLEYPGHASAQLAYSWVQPSLLKGVFQHSHICGEKGRIIFESNGLYVVLRSAGKTRLYLFDPRDLLGYGSMTNDFLACLEDNNRTPYSDFSRARRDLTIVFRAYENATNGGRPRK